MGTYNLITNRTPKNADEAKYWALRERCAAQDKIRRHKMYEYFNALMKYNDEVLKPKHKIANEFEKCFGRHGVYPHKATGYFPLTFAVIRAAFATYTEVRRAQNYYNHDRVARDKSIREDIVVQMRKYVAQKWKAYIEETYDWSSPDDFDNKIILMIAWYNLHEDYPDRSEFDPQLVAQRKKRTIKLLSSESKALTPLRFEQKAVVFRTLTQIVAYLYDYII